ncbi:putative oxalate decarboxylase/oxidase [Mycena latifolia]|nr:putative oxalate decarboxylase/oxidase [Mycena latifolia]
MLRNAYISAATVFSSIIFTAAAPAVVLGLHSNPDANSQVWNGNSKITPEPIRGSLGAIILGPQNVPVALQNADSLAPPSTDSGQVPNIKRSFSQSQIDCTVKNLVHVIDIHLTRALRELHWHNTAEWAYVLKGDVRITTVTPDGQVYVADVGDSWYFPPGNPHSLKVVCNYLYSCSKQLYIFPSSPPPDGVESDMVVPNTTPNPYTFALSKVVGTKKPGGTIKVVDSRTFNVAQAISAVEVTVEVGGMRIPSVVLQGTTRHYIVNTGNPTLKFLEIFKSNMFQDISLTQWLAHTPPELVKAHLGFSDETIASLSRVKYEVV